MPRRKDWFDNWYCLHAIYVSSIPVFVFWGDNCQWMYSRPTSAPIYQASIAHSTFELVVRIVIIHEYKQLSCFHAIWTLFEDTIISYDTVLLRFDLVPFPSFSISCNRVPTDGGNLVSNTLVLCVHKACLWILLATFETMLSTRFLLLLHHPYIFGLIELALWDFFLTNNFWRRESFANGGKSDWTILNSL